MYFIVNLIVVTYHLIYSGRHHVCQIEITVPVKGLKQDTGNDEGCFLKKEKVISSDMPWAPNTSEDLR